MNSLTFLIKPASSLCNMRCKYCFYEDIADNRVQKSMGMMTEDTAERIIREAFRLVSPGGSISFLFQGGEPTLAGLDFFQNFLALERKYAKPGVHCHHAMQTNGFRLDAQWAAFFREHQFLLGISMDGTQAIHDSLRIDATGAGTWEKTTAALRLLEQFHVETNILCVVTAQVAKKPHQVYKSLAQLGAHPVQFIPCLDPMENIRGSEFYSLTPEAYGKFLCGLFDCWYRDWKAGNYISIRTFDDYLRLLMRLPPSSCAASGACGSYLVVEGDGSLYPCDFYVLDEWKIGNIRDMHVEEALKNPVSLRFIREGAVRPESCGSCRYFPICRGGCKRDWTQQHTNYYCTSFKTFFDYSLPRLQEMARAALGR